jgi:hypothetical protein
MMKERTREDGMTKNEKGIDEKQKKSTEFVENERR